MRNYFFAAAAAVGVTSCAGGATMPRLVPQRDALLRSAVQAPAVRYRFVALGKGLIPAKIVNAGIVVGLDSVTQRGFEYRGGHVTEMPVLPGDTTSNALDVNDRGDIVGYSFDPQALANCPSACPVEHAVLFAGGRLTDLGSVPQTDGATNVVNSADLINDRGEILGESGYPHDLARFSDVAVFRPGPVRPITIDGAIVYGEPLGLNDAGEIVGESEAPSLGIISGSFAYPHAIVCSPPLVVAGGAIFDVNGGGGVAGISSGNGFFCSRGIFHVLPLYPSALNNAGEIVGFATPPQTMLYAYGALRPVTFASARLDEPVISKHHTAAGYALSVSYGDAVLYTRGRLYDLDSIVGGPPGLVLQNPTSINDAGDVVGYTFGADGSVVGYLLERQ